MGNKGLPKSLQVYYSKMKNATLQLSYPSPASTAVAGASAWILSACKHPKTHSVDVTRRNGNGDTAASATLADIDRFLHENFRSLCDDNDNEEHAEKQYTATVSEPLHYSRVKASKYVFSEEGSRESSDSSTVSVETKMFDAMPAGGIPVVTLSRDPYEEFRRSMMDMAEVHAKKASDRSLDWDFMEELLLCYLELNDRSVHKYVLRAFADLAVSFQCSFGFSK